MEDWRKEFEGAKAVPLGPMTKDRRGEAYGELYPYEYLGTRVFENGQRHAVWRCRCICGKDIVMYSGLLASAREHSCGCRPPKGPKRIDLTGKRFLGLIVQANGAADFVQVRCTEGHVNEIPHRKLRLWYSASLLGRTTPACPTCRDKAEKRRGA